MKEYTTAEIFDELWERIEFDANVSEELATESNELQARINKAIKLIKETKGYYHDGIDEELLEILKGE